MRWHWITGPAALAVVVTLANAGKPVVVDDAAYLAYARQIAHHPLDPYGFDIFWYTVPLPAMEVLCPPVVPYWLAAGVRLFGDEPALLKLWLFPFVWLFAWSLAVLLRRFARGADRATLLLVVLSPAVLPMVNLMLDIPAAALGLAALVLFARASDRGSWQLAAAAGAVAALAMQTKYTALLVPPLLAWYGLTHRRLRLAAVAVGVSVVGFAAWEYALVQKYDRSHFLFHVNDQSAADGGGIAGFIHDKAPLAPALAAHLGCLAVGVGLYAGRAAGVPRRALVAVAVVWVVGVGLVAALPYRDAILLAGKDDGRAKLTLAATVWRTAGAGVLLTSAAAAGLLLVRFQRRPGLRRSADAWFVVGWVAIELAGYFVLTPFPAARRVIGVTITLGVLAARVVSRVNRTDARRHPPRWVVPFGVAVGVLVAALDTFDAFPEKVIAERAASVTSTQGPGVKTWYVGHWGFQYYCERAGMRAVVPGQSELAAGDLLVVPIFPKDKEFYRPDSFHARLELPDDAVEQVEEIVWDDALSARTIPSLYGGPDPITGRDHPRLRVGVFRILRPWAVPRAR